MHTNTKKNTYVFPPSILFFFLHFILQITLMRADLLCLNCATHLKVTPLAGKNKIYWNEAEEEEGGKRKREEKKENTKQQHKQKQSIKNSRTRERTREEKKRVAN